MPSMKDEHLKYRWFGTLTLFSKPSYQFAFNVKSVMNMSYLQCFMFKKVTNDSKI